MLFFQRYSCVTKFATRDLTTWEQIIEKVIIQIENWNVFTQVELFGIFG